MKISIGLRSAVLGAAVALVLSACGGAASDDDAGDGDGDGNKQEEIKVGMASSSATWVPFFVAKHNGYFKDEGLKVNDPVQLGSGAKSAAALAGGGIDVSLGIAPDVFNLASNGQDVKLLGTIYNAYSVDVVVGNKFKVDANASLDEKVKALKGKKIGITGPGSGTEALITYLFKEAGLDASKDADLVGLGGDPSAALNALQAGKVDALSHVLSVGQKAEDEKIGTLYISPSRGDVPKLVGTAHGALYTLQGVIDKKPDAIKGFSAAYQRGMQFFKENPEESKAILQDYLSGMSPAVVDQLMPVLSKSFPDKLEVDPKGWDIETDMVYSTGLVEGDPPKLEDLTAPDMLPSS